MADRGGTEGVADTTGEKAGDDEEATVVEEEEAARVKMRIGNASVVAGAACRRLSQSAKQFDEPSTKCTVAPEAATVCAHPEMDFGAFGSDRASRARWSEKMVAFRISGQ